MIRTITIVSDLTDIPVEWTFEHYLNLPEKLTGQDLMIRSVFGAKDKNPSLSIYYSMSKGRYLFQDFSTGIGGDALELVRKLFNFEKRSDAAFKVVADYNKYTLTNDVHIVGQFKINNKYKIDKYKLRTWTVYDQKYWMNYRIDSKTLEKYNVTPIKEYEMFNGKDKLKIKGLYLYGYFTKKGILYKVYQPMTDKGKFIKVSSYIHGHDQLTFDKPYLVICSSLKDIMAFDKLRFKNAEAIAPESENTLISENIINKYKDRYSKICTLFDNDTPGIRSMEKYRARYGINPVLLRLEKDLSDSIEAHGINNVRIQLYPLLTKALTGTIKNIP
jgi:hypothetical protein